MKNKIMSRSCHLSGVQLLSEAKLQTNKSPFAQDLTLQVDMQENNDPQPNSSKLVSRISRRKHLKIRPWHEGDVPFIEEIVT